MQILGFEIKRSAKAENETKTLERVSQPQPDGSLDIQVLEGISGTNSYYFDFDFNVREDKEQIQLYRQISRLADVDDAIDEVVNECIVVEDQENIVDIMLDNTKFSPKIKKKIADEFEYLLGLLNFHDNGDQIFRQWYIDGRHYYHKVVDSANQKEGIKELNWLDPVKTKKVREIEKKKKKVGGKTIETVNVKDEYFLYDPAITTYGDASQAAFSVSQEQNVLKLSLDSVAYTTSGLMDLDKGKVLSYLHKAIKPANQLSLLEDSMVVYRLTRAPERRIFYIDIGNLGSSRAEQYVTNIMQKYKNRLVYDVDTGSVDATKVHMSMMEDIWLPRKEGGRGTEVSTLPAGANLGDIDDVLYFKRRLVKAMKIPVSRMDAEGALFSIGVSGEVTRDELKFTKYVDKVRRRFNTFFYDLLRTQLLLKKVVTEEEWKENKPKIGFIYNRDSYIAELQKSEMWRQRFELLQSAVDFTGENNYLSQRWNRDNILRLSEDDVRQIEKDWKGEPEPEDIVTHALIGQEPGMEEVPGQPPERPKPPAEKNPVEKKPEEPKKDEQG